MLDLGISKTSQIPEVPWHKSGLCYRAGYDLFFPIDKEDARYKNPKAKAICSTPCPVKSLCLQYALETECLYGVWGGTTRSERKRIMKHLAETGQTPKEWLESHGQDTR